MRGTHSSGGTKRQDLFAALTPSGPPVGVACAKASAEPASQVQIGSPIQKHIPRITRGIHSSGSTKRQDLFAALTPSGPPVGVACAKASAEPASQVQIGPPIQKHIPRITRGICFWSERQDLNLRPLDPKSRALPDCATLRSNELYKLPAVFSRLKKE